MSVVSLVNRDQAVALHRSGRIPEAVTAYKALLAEPPGNADLLGLLAIANEQMGNAVESERLFRSSLERAQPVPILYRNLNNLLGLLIDSDRASDAISVIENIELPAWPKERNPDGVERDTIVSLIAALATLGRKDSALALALQCAPFLSGDLDFAVQFAELLHGDGRLSDARAVLSRDFGGQEENPNLHAIRAALAFQQEDYKASSASAARFSSSLPVLLSEASATQEFCVVVFNASPQQIRDFRSSEVLHYSGNYPSQLANRLSDSFRFVSVLADAPNIETAMRQLPCPALAVNNYVNAERLLVGDTLQKVSTAEDSLGIPVINHPRIAMQATRQKNSERFANVPGIVASRISRYLSDRSQRAALISDIEGRYAYPLIVRTVFQQMGEGTWLVQNRRGLGEALDKTDGQQFYAINYINLRHRNGYFRNMRAAFVNREWILVRVDYSESWNVRTRRREYIRDFYYKNHGLMELADDTIVNPEKHLAPASFRALDTIGQMMPLDIFGVDFDISDEGDLVLFEANATMNLLSSALEEVDYPQVTQLKFLDAVRSFFRQRAASTH